MNINTLKKGTIEKFLRRMQSKSRAAAPNLDVMLKEILAKANEFVPSEAGSILLDDPQRKSQHVGNPRRNLLYLVACFGPGSGKLLGATQPVTQGVAGKTYLTGRPTVIKDAAEDKSFHDGIDARLGRRTRSILCVPIVIGKSVCGVIELLNRKARQSYSTEDKKLLEIFAGYTSTLIQNALDAKRNEELTRRDDLTGLFNDRYFHQQLTEEIKKAKKARKDISLLFLDLDNFKTINDTFGHLAGSRTLSEVGALLRDTLEGDNARIVRYGGDEFAVILPGRTRMEAFLVADKVRAAVEKAVFLRRVSPRGDLAYNIGGVITCSIGVSSFFEDTMDGGTLEEEKISFIRQADQAMYLAKERGKNLVCLGADCELSTPVKPQPARGRGRAKKG